MPYSSPKPRGRRARSALRLQRLPDPRRGRRVAAFCLVAAAVLVFPSDAAAQRSDWTFGAVWERQFIDSELPQWEDWEAWRGFGRWRGESATVHAEVARERRFGVTDETALLDLYHDLGAARYGNLRLRVTPDASILPDWDIRGELFQSFGAWEASVSFWHMEFDAPVRIVGVGAARYLPGWYLRGIILRATNSDESALSFNLAARRLLDDGGALTLLAGRGEEVVLLGPGPTIDLRTTSVIRADLETWLTDRLGLTAALARNSFEGAPSRLLVSLGASLRLRTPR